jgi:hypothetical protein
MTLCPHGVFRDSCRECFNEAAPVSPDAPDAPVSWGGSSGSTAPVAPPAPDAPVSFGGSAGSGAGIIGEVRAWFARYVSTVNADDLDLLALWAVHTHLVDVTYSTPRLIIDSPVPGSGKTTTLEHLGRLCVNPVQMAAISSSALLVRILQNGMRTLLIDEVDRTLDPKKETTGELVAILNSGYKKGGTRPVLEPDKAGGFKTVEMPTFAPVAMAGNSPNLPDDTRSRSIRVLLMPDTDGTIEESDWEWIEDDATALRDRIAAWANRVRESVKATRPELPEQVKNRARERWSPLKRVAVACGGDWPAVVDRLAAADIEEEALTREEGLVIARPHVVVLEHLAAIWTDKATFLSTEEVIRRLISHDPDMWGNGSSFGKALTAQRLGRMLSQNYRVHSDRLDRTGPRGYLLATLAPVFRRFHLTPGKQTGASGASGETGAGRSDGWPEGSTGEAAR